MRSDLENKLLALVQEHVHTDGDLPSYDELLAMDMESSGVESADFIVLWQAVNEEFGADIGADTFADNATFSDLVSFLQGGGGD